MLPLPEGLPNQRISFMDELLCQPLWAELAKASKNSKNRTAAIAYFTSEKFVQFRQGDCLVVDASDQAIITRQTSRTLLRKLMKRGVRVYSLPMLHGKIIAFEKSAFVGSMNFSDTSPKLTEIALKVTKRELVAEVRSMTLSLAAKADEVDEDFIERVMKLKLVPKRRGGLGGRSRTRRASQLWLLSTRDLSDSVIEKEATTAARGKAKAAAAASLKGEIEDIRFTVRPGVKPRMRFLRQAMRGDRVIELYTSPKGVTTVYREGYIRHFQRTKTWQRVYLEWPDYTEKTWKGFARVWETAGGSPISPKANRLVSDMTAKRLFAHW